jgi:hypothetical protein
MQRRTSIQPSATSMNGAQAAAVRSARPSAPHCSMGISF